MKQAHISLCQCKFAALSSFEKMSESYIYMYTCINNFNKQLPIDHGKEYDLNYSNLA